MLELEEIIHGSAKTNGIRWYGRMLKRDDDRVLRVALDFKLVTRENEYDQIRPGISKLKRKEKSLV